MAGKAFAIDDNGDENTAARHGVSERREHQLKIYCEERTHLPPCSTFRVTNNVHAHTHSRLRSRSTTHIPHSATVWRVVATLSQLLTLDNLETSPEQSTLGRYVTSSNTSKNDPTGRSISTCTGRRRASRNIQIFIRRPVGYWPSSTTRREDLKASMVPMPVSICSDSPTSTCNV